MEQKNIIGITGTVVDRIDDLKRVWQSAVADGKCTSSLEEYIDQSPFERFIVEFDKEFANLSSTAAAIPKQLVTEEGIEAGQRVAAKAHIPGRTGQTVVATKIIKLG